MYTYVLCSRIRAGYCALIKWNCTTSDLTMFVRLIFHLLISQYHNQLSVIRNLTEESIHDRRELTKVRPLFCIGIPASSHHSITMKRSNHGNYFAHTHTHPYTCSHTMPTKRNQYLSRTYI